MIFFKHPLQLIFENYSFKRLKPLYVMYFFVILIGGYFSIHLQTEWKGGREGERRDEERQRHGLVASRRTLSRTGVAEPEPRSLPLTGVEPETHWAAGRALTAEPNAPG